MGSVYETDDGQWRAVLTMPNGRRRSKTVATQNKAKQALAAMTLERDRITGTGVIAPDDLTVGDVIDSWLALDLPGRKLAPGTVFSYENRCASLKRELGTRRTATLRVRDLDDAFLRLAGYSHGTLSKQRGVLAQIFDFAIKREEMSTNLARRITLPINVKPARETHAMTADQAKEFLSLTARHRWHALFVTGIYLGMRPGELTALCWDAIDFDAGTITVKRGVQRTKTCQSYLTDDLKTTRARRTIPAGARVLDALRNHREIQQLEDAVSGIVSPLVFRTSTGTLIALRNLNREFQMLTESIPGHWTPNEMRHTAASLMVDAEIPYAVIADILGHTTTRMLELTYRKARPVVRGSVHEMAALLG